MESLNAQLQPFFEWLLRTTLQASLLICVIVLLQRILRNRLSIRWHYGLWLLLLVRMSLPWAPQSRASLFNLIPRPTYQQQEEYNQQQNSKQSISSDVTSSEPVESVPASGAVTTQKSPAAAPAKPSINIDVKMKLKPDFSKIVKLLPPLWLTGALILALYVCAGNFNLWRIVKSRRPLTDQGILDLLEDCKSQMGIQTILGIVTTDKVKSPALFGFVRPRLLLPTGMIDNLSSEELRFVFLHELAHLKRHDIYIGWLISALQVLHWFNPLVWLAFRRMRADRELACDALVLDRSRSDEPKSYGRIIVSLLERFSCPRFLPGMAGILETKAQLKRRVIMIAKFKKNSYQWSPIAVILIIILACISLPDPIGTRASQTSAAESSPPIALRRVWAGPDVATEGAVSPDGRYISYTDWDTGDLAVYEIATGKKRRLTNKGTWEESNEYAEFSRWSPDGKQIVYDWYNKDYFIELRIVGLDGSESQILFSNKEVGWAQTYDWSPDGNQILACFSNKDGSNQIVMVSVTDGSVRILKTLERYPQNMSFSPDGRYIAYDFPQKENFPESDIFLLLADGNREIPLVEHPSNDRILDWTPDGKNILFTSDRTGSPCMWSIVIADGIVQGIPKLVKPDIGQGIVSMGFTQDGSFYYGRGGRGMSDIYIAKLDPKTANVLIPSKKTIQRFEGHNATPDYSPDGKCLAYVSHRGRKHFLCIRSLETGQEQEFTSKLMRMTGPRWSPDGGSILVAGMDYNNNRFGNYRVDPQTGTFTPVLPPSKDFRFSSHEWSRDGKSFFLGRSSVKDKYSQIMLREIKSGKEREIYRIPRFERFRLACSADGKWLAFINMRNDSALRIIPSAGGESRELYKCEPKKEQLMTCKWTADGKYILFVKRRIGQIGLNLWRIPVEGGEPQKIDLGINTLGLSIHPDCQHIAFWAMENQPAEVWVMENFLPEATVAKPAHQPNFKKIRIPTKPGNGVLSPDGKKLAFVSKRSIWVVPVHGKVSDDIAGEPIRLPGIEKAWHWCTSWSADGAWIAYGNPDEICIVPSSGGKVKKIPVEVRGGSNVFDWRISLSRDGRTVAYGSEVKDKMQIFTTDVESGDFKQLTEDGGTQPCFSPDGKRIAYVKPKLQKTSIPKSDVWVRPATGGKPIQVSDLPGRATGPVWSPDGKRIAFTRKAGGDDMSKEICIIPVPESGKPEATPTQIELPLETWRHLAGWTPDNEIGVLLSNPEHQAIYTVGASGGNATQVTPEGYAFHPRWSPDGERIYFRWNGGNIASVPSEGGEISTVPLDADSKIFVALPGAGNAVSPDGKKITFSGAKEVLEGEKRRYEVYIYTIPIEGGEPKKLTKSPGQDRFPCWSPDGNSIAFVRYPEPTKEMSICIVPTEGGEVRQLTSESHRVKWSTIAWSPDGKSMAYFSGKNINVIPKEGGEPKAVVKVVDVSDHSELAWSPDVSKLVYSSKGSIWVVSLDGGEPEQIKTGLDAKATHLSWSPDGKKIAFTATRGGDAEFWLMENFLPETVAVTRK